ncbi:hypothetical protein BBJ66_01655 [Rhizobium sp. RSm-3]|nr:hypothetical protein BBJ66_01655 [Rhizobium sp. RSm-3]
MGRFGAPSFVPSPASQSKWDEVRAIAQNEIELGIIRQELEELDQRVADTIINRIENTVL